jgi:hypothetical protein
LGSETFLGEDVGERVDAVNDFRDVLFFVEVGELKEEDLEVK